MKYTPLMDTFPEHFSPHLCHSELAVAVG